jgi:hypothetical protein
VEITITPVSSSSLHPPPFSTPTDNTVDFTSDFVSHFSVNTTTGSTPYKYALSNATFPGIIFEISILPYAY